MIDAITAVLADEAATRAFGAAIAGALDPGAVLALCGPLGAGKTTFCQGLAAGLGVDPEARVSSPTFTICNEYPGPTPLLHVDLYRLGSVEEADDIGLLDRVGASGVTLVEWADRVPVLLPPDALWIRLEPEGGRRRVWLWEGDGGDPGWAAAIQLPAAGGAERWEAVRRPS